MVNYLNLLKGPNISIYQKIFTDTKKTDDIYNILKHTYLLKQVTDVKKTRTF